ncbi:MAG: hypothetical protein JHC56_15115 [Gemmataceae bacterium]|nr:hypothetical protein [Gemmataceae bacterium]
MRKKSKNICKSMIQPLAIGIATLNCSLTATGKVRAARKLWVTTWENRTLLHYAPKTKTWTLFKLHGLGPRIYSTFVDNKEKVWSSDFEKNSITQFDASNQTFMVFAGKKQNIQTLLINSIDNPVRSGQQGVDQVALFENIKE